MLSMVAVLPEPPLLLPELATGAAPETADLRAACAAAASRLAGAATRWIAVGGDAGGRRTVASGARGSFVGFGVDVVVGLAPLARNGSARNGSARNGSARNGSAPNGSAPNGSAPNGSARGGSVPERSVPEGAQREGPVSGGTAPGGSAGVDPRFPLPLLVAGWAAGRTGMPVRIRGELVAPDAPPDSCLALGEALAAECAADGEPVGLLVVGDGAATHTEKAPGHLDERAGPFDVAVAAALRDADPTALAELDAGLAEELWASGRAPWQVLAGATRGGAWRGELLHSSMPFGVAYHVAVWTPSG